MMVWRLKDWVVSIRRLLRLAKEAERKAERAKVRQEKAERAPERVKIEVSQPKEIGKAVKETPGTERVAACVCSLLSVVHALEELLVLTNMNIRKTTQRTNTTESSTCELSRSPDRLDRHAKGKEAVCVGMEK